MLPYLVLLRMGFTVPSAVTVDAVSSYLAVSPLPDPLARPSAVCSLLHFPLPWVLRPYSTQPLTGILPCGARTFLPMPQLPADIQRLPGRLSGTNYRTAKLQQGIMLGWFSPDR